MRMIARVVHIDAFVEDCDQDCCCDASSPSYHSDRVLGVVAAKGGGGMVASVCGNQKKALRTRYTYKCATATRILSPCETVRSGGVPRKHIDPGSLGGAHVCSCGGRRRWSYPEVVLGQRDRAREKTIHIISEPLSGLQHKQQP